MKHWALSVPARVLQWNYHPYLVDYEHHRHQIHLDFLECVRLELNQFLLLHHQEQLLVVQTWSFHQFHLYHNRDY